MNSRNDILARIRAALAVDTDDAARRALAQASLATPTSGPRPCAEDDLAARFRAKSEAQSATFQQVPSLCDVPTAVARYMTMLGLPARAVCWPALSELDWAGAGLDIAARAVNGEDAIGITGCFCAIAETGTLMLVSGPDTAAATSLLPETHIAVVPVAHIVPAMEEAFALLRAEYGSDLPRAVNFVSGPSRTGDIEQTIVLGAHGPYRVHIVLVDSA